MNKLIKINLNQTVSKAQLEQIKEEQKRWIIFGSICFLFIGYLLWFSFINNRMNYVIDNRISTIENIKKQTEALKNEGKINLSKKDIVTLNNFEKKRMFWSPKLLALTDITPENMTITGLDYENKRLEISGMTTTSPDQRDDEIVANFMNRIMENSEFKKNFKDIKYKDISRENEKGQLVVNFVVEARLKK